MLKELQESTINSGPDLNFYELCLSLYNLLKIGCRCKCSELVSGLFRIRKLVRYHTHDVICKRNKVPCQPTTSCIPLHRYNNGKKRYASSPPPLIPPLSLSCCQTIQTKQTNIPSSPLPSEIPNNSRAPNLDGDDGLLQNPRTPPSASSFVNAQIRPCWYVCFFFPLSSFLACERELKDCFPPSPPQGRRVEEGGNCVSQEGRERRTNVGGICGRMRITWA